MARTRLGSNDAGAFVLRDRLDELRGVTIRGPALVDVDADELYVPAPMDAVFLEGADGGAQLQALRPIAVPEDCQIDHDVTDLALLALPDENRAKPLRDAPAFWAFSELEAWLRGDFHEGRRGLLGPTPHDVVRSLDALPTERRVHVSIDASSGTAREGHLFETEALRFADERHRTRRQLGLRLEVADLPGCEIRSGVGPFGGERRLVTWSPATSGWPPVPEWLRTAIRQGGEATVRVVLLTPGLFEGGFIPGGSSPLLGGAPGCELVAARVPAPLTVSGWDLAAGAPKPSRRAVPAGSVYWVKLGGSADEREQWLTEVWMRNVSCEEQDQLDGWGLAAVGVVP